MPTAPRSGPVSVWGLSHALCLHFTSVAVQSVTVEQDLMASSSRAAWIRTHRRGQTPLLLYCQQGAKSRPIRPYVAQGICLLYLPRRSLFLPGGHSSLSPTPTALRGLVLRRHHLNLSSRQQRLLVLFVPPARRLRTADSFPPFARRRFARCRRATLCTRLAKTACMWRVCESESYGESAGIRGNAPRAAVLRCPPKGCDRRGCTRTLSLCTSCRVCWASSRLNTRPPGGW